MTTSTLTKSPGTSAITDQEVLDLERDYWDAMKARDAGKVGRLTAEDSTNVNASGVAGIGSQDIGKLLEAAPYRIKGYRIDPLSTRITRISDDVVAIAYGVHEDLEVDGQPVKLEAFDTTVWRHTAAGWTCVQHTESIAGDGFGRDRLTGKRPG